MAQTGKVYFLKGDGAPRYDDVKEGCPSDSELCKMKSYLVPEDVVVTSRVHLDWTCAALVTKNGRTIMGWLPSSKLQDVAITHPKINDWSGSWTMNKNRPH